MKVKVIVKHRLHVCSKRFDERLLLLGLGIVPMLVGRAVMFPVAGPHPPVSCAREDEGWLQRHNFTAACEAACLAHNSSAAAVAAVLREHDNYTSTTAASWATSGQFTYNYRI